MPLAPNLRAACVLSTPVRCRHAGGDTCAEIVTLATAATQGVAQLETIVVVGDRGREVLPPCARCRQILLDHFPGIRVILGPADEIRVVPIADLKISTTSL